MESIYHWIEHEEPPPPQRERHRSRFDPRQPPTASTFVLPNTTKVRGANLGSESTEAVMRRKNRSGTATIGPPREELRPDPRGFRKSPTAKPAQPHADPPPSASPARPGARAGALSRPSNPGVTRAAAVRRAVNTHTHRQRRKPAVPSREDKPVYGVRSSKNFVVSNAVENILAGACGRRGAATARRERNRCRSLRPLRVRPARPSLRAATEHSAQAQDERGRVLPHKGGLRQDAQVPGAREAGD